MNYCAESKAVGSSRNDNPDKKSKPGSIHIDPGSFLIGICI